MPAIFLGLLIATVLLVPRVSTYARAVPAPLVAATLPADTTRTSGTAPATNVPAVPFYSQFADIASPAWQKVGCGITDLAMVVNYWHPGAVTVEGLLAAGIKAGAYDYNAGWIYQGLIDLAGRHGLSGYYTQLPADKSAALARLKELTAAGPVILSVHYRFDPASTIPHLVVVDGVEGDTIYVNDPATTRGTERLTREAFLAGAKRNVIVVRPANAL